MVEHEPKRAFISYVKENSAEVDRLCEILEAARIPYWRDRKDLGAGDEWRRKIRTAIEGNALAFIACFSDASRARDRSYMNEELTLAVTEYRMRPPGATWLLPVRFDDGPIPEWDLGAGRSFSDINYSDLFGEKYAVEVAKLITAINHVIGAPSSDAASTQTALNEATNQTRPATIRRLTKEMILDPVRRIELDDLIQTETRRILHGLADETTFPLSMPAEDQATFYNAQAEAYWQLVEPMIWSTQVAARWADSSALDAWAKGIRSISATGTQMRSGNSALTALRALPALCLVMTAAIAAVGQGRWDNLASLVINSTIPDGMRGQRPLIDAIHPWTPFDNEHLAEVVARAAVQGTSPAETIERSRSRGGNYYTPGSEYLAHKLQPVFEDQFASETDFLEAFARAENFLGVLSQDGGQARRAAGRLLSGPRWFGRSTWSPDRHFTNPIADLRAELDAQGNRWPPLICGLFGGDAARAAAAIDAYKENYDAVSSRRR